MHFRCYSLALYPADVEMAGAVGLTALIAAAAALAAMVALAAIPMDMETAVATVFTASPAEMTDAATIVLIATDGGGNHCIAAANKNKALKFQSFAAVILAGCKRPDKFH